MAIDVWTKTLIRRPRGVVAAYAVDPDNATAWYGNIKEVRWETEKPLAVGSRVAFVAEFLGRRLAYTYAVRELVAGERFVMATSQGPFAMETTYVFNDAPDGATTMRLRNRGEPSGFSRLLTPVMGLAVARANRRDLARLKGILERQT